MHYRGKTSEHVKYTPPLLILQRVLWEWATVARAQILKLVSPTLWLAGREVPYLSWFGHMTSARSISSTFFGISPWASCSWGTHACASSHSPLRRHSQKNPKSCFWEAVSSFPNGWCIFPAQSAGRQKEMNYAKHIVNFLIRGIPPRNNRQERVTTSRTEKGGAYVSNYLCKYDLTYYYLLLKSSTFSLGVDPISLRASNIEFTLIVTLARGADPKLDFRLSSRTLCPIRLQIPRWSSL